MANWTRVDIVTTTEGIEIVSAMLSELGLGSIQIQDVKDFEELVTHKTIHWDYIEDELMEELTKAPTLVTVYVDQLAQGEGQLNALTLGLAALKKQDAELSWGSLAHHTSVVREEDWATAWKQYYHPLSIGRLLICPTWEEALPADGQAVLKMDPGMAFGTGTHESTRLCLEILSDVSQGGERVLDIGSGSGILSIGALLLGANEAEGVDIDQVAVGVAQANAKENNLTDKASYRKGSFAQFATGTYDIIFANIVANAIIELAPMIPPLLAPGGSFICSGIIDTRADEVALALSASGLPLAETRTDGGWVAFRSLGIKEEQPRA